MNILYDVFKYYLLYPLGLGGTSLNVALFTSSLVAPDATDLLYGAAPYNANEVVGAGYVAGGANITIKSVTNDNTNHWAVFDADDISWPNSTITARYALIYATGTNAVRALFDFGSDQTSVNGLFKIEWNANGIFRLA